MVHHGIAKLSNGIELAYDDSGSVDGLVNYTTIIFIHGSGFNAHTFERLHPLASLSDLRAIAFQRRDYPGSTPFSEEELEELRSGSENYVKNTGKIVLEFIKYVVEELGVPAMSEEGERKQGGIVVVGWSFGTSVALTVLSNPELVDDATKGLLEQYLRSVVVYDSPSLALGIEPPSGEPIAGTPSSAEERLAKFPISISSYYNNPAERPIGTGEGQGWSGDPNQLDRRFEAEKASWFDWTQEEREKYVTMGALIRCEVPTWMEPLQTSLRSSTNRALFSSDLAQTFLPNVRIGILSVGKSFWPCRWGVWKVRNLYEDKLKEGEVLREMKSAHLEDCNHLAHLDDPEVFLDALKSLL